MNLLTGGGDFPQQTIIMPDDGPGTWMYILGAVVVPVVIALIHLWRRP